MFPTKEFTSGCKKNYNLRNVLKPQDLKEGWLTYFGGSSLGINFFLVTSCLSQMVVDFF